MTRGRAATRRLRVLVGANLVAGAALLAVGGWDVIQLYTGIGLPERRGPPMELVAHRGDLDRFPENTLEAIRAAAELPIDGIEFDVVMSAEGTWWVIHDTRLDRTTDASGFIPELDDATIAAARVDGGIGFDSSAHANLRVPLLDQVLRALDDYAGTVYVDVQHAPAGEVAEIASMIRSRDAAVLCRDLSDANAVKRVDPSIKTFIRPEDGPADANVDGWLMEAFFEADVGALEQSTLPVVTFVDQWRAGEDESLMMRRAWSVGVAAFLTKQPGAAIATRKTLLERWAAR